MLSLKNSLRVLKKTNALLEGHFILSSGLHSAQYVQCAKLLSYPKLSEKFVKSLASKIKKKIKKNSRVLIVEDVITTGKSSIECAKLIKKYNAKLVGFACLIDRSDNTKIKHKIISQVKIKIPIYSEKNLPSFLKNKPVTKPGSRFLK